MHNQNLWVQRQGIEISKSLQAILMNLELWAPLCSTSGSDCDGGSKPAGALSDHDVNTINRSPRSKLPSLVLSSQLAYPIAYWCHHLLHNRDFKYNTSTSELGLDWKWSLASSVLLHVLPVVLPISVNSSITYPAVHAKNVDIFDYFCLFPLCVLFLEMPHSPLTQEGLCVC